MENDLFGTLAPEAVLYEFEGPCIYTARLADQSRVLVYRCGAEQVLTRYLVVPLSDDLLQRLVLGQLPVREVFDQPQVWLVTQEPDGRVGHVAQLSTADLPVTALPKPGVLL